VSNCKSGSQPDLRLSSNTDHSQTCISSQTQIPARLASQFKRGSQPDPRLTPNAISAKLAFHLKRGSQPDPRLTVNVEDQPDPRLNSNTSLRAPCFNNRIEPATNP